MTTQPDIDAIAIAAAEACSTCELAILPSVAAQEKRTEIIAAAIRRAQVETYPNLFQELSRQITELKSERDRLDQENKDLAKAMALKTKLEHHLSEALSERDAAVNGMLDLKGTNQMLAEQLQKHAEAIAVLKDVEWFRGRCTCCGQLRSDGHDPDCKLAKAIGK